MILTRFHKWLGASLSFAFPAFGVPRGLQAAQVLRDATKDLRLCFDCRQWSRRQWEDFWGDARAMAIPNVKGAELLSVIPASAFFTPEWQTFAPGIQEITELVRWPLYAYKVYAAAGQTQLTLFDQNEGNATEGRLDTNMVGNGGQLPGGQMQVVVGVGVEFFPDDADVFVANALGKAGIEGYDALTLGWLEAKVNAKDYMVGAPLWRFGQGFGPGTFVNSTAPSATAYSAQYLNNGHPSNQGRFNMDPPLTLRPGQPFDYKLKWNTAQALTNAGRIGVGLEGWQARLVL